MTREEQIIKIGAQFAIDETDGQTSGRAASMRGVLLSAFRAGAHWADSHSNWISVEEELPKEGQVVLINTKGGSVSTACYTDGRFDITELFEAINVTHWMEIHPPRKEK